MKTKKIVKFMRDHPLISVRGLEKSVGAPLATIAHAMVGSRKIPRKYHAAIEKELQSYGYQ